MNEASFLSPTHAGEIYIQIFIKKTITIIQVYAKWHGTKIYTEKSHLFPRQVGVGNQDNFQRQGDI